MDKEFFTETFLPLRGKLIGYAMRFMNSKADAEDIVQEVFAKLWTVREDLWRYKNVSALSFKITKNLCINRLRQERLKRNYCERATAEDEELSPYASVEQRDAVDNIIKIIDRLPDLQQSILRMRYIDGLEVEEIAELIGSKPEAIWMNLSRARKKVKELFNKIENHDGKL